MNDTSKPGEGGTLDGRPVFIGTATGSGGSGGLDPHSGRDPRRGNSGSAGGSTIRRQIDGYWYTSTDNGETYRREPHPFG